MNFFFAQTLFDGGMPSLNAIWFVLVGILFTGYAMLDGFDLGVGALHLFTKTDEERRHMLNAIGPVWDGNEVWLVTGGGALFAAFPEVYATVFSGFYLAFVLLLFSLIFRAVAIEFRSKRPEVWWRQTWDVLFSLGSVLSSFLIGVAIGNIIWGIPLDQDHEFAGTFLGLLGPYPLLLGVTTVALFAMHGAIYVVMKTEGELEARARGWIRNTIIFFVLAYATTTLATLLYIPRMALPLQQHPWLFIIPLLNVLAVANIPREIHLGNEFKAFLSSCAAMIALMALFGIGMYPHLVFSHTEPANSLDIFNAASSQKTLGIMLIIACMGVPVVLTYTVCIYWIFRGKVKLDPMSY
jgi:cytochrome d ubiquinol oxidase subunit II